MDLRKRFTVRARVIPLVGLVARHWALLEHVADHVVQPVRGGEHFQLHRPGRIDLGHDGSVGAFADEAKMPLRVLREKLNRRSNWRDHGNLQGLWGRREDLSPDEPSPLQGDPDGRYLARVNARREPCSARWQPHWQPRRTWRPPPQSARLRGL